MKKKTDGITGWQMQQFGNCNLLANDGYEGSESEKKCP
jgi:hypothetical protein